MSMRELPASVVEVIEGAFVSEFATISAAGVPIDTPTYCFASDDLSLVGVATGIAYPAKAERARRNPKVGLLIEGQPGQPIVSIRGRAAVRDSDIQGNAIRYISETGYEAVAMSAGVDWTKAREAVWYWSRIIVDIMPEQVLWWDNAEAMDNAPHVWTGSVPADFVSDPTPPGKTSAAPSWGQPSWQDIAASAIGRNAPGYLTVVDDNGFPLPIRSRSLSLEGDRFRLDIPRGAPWKAQGKASLSFQGVENFVGEVAQEGDVVWFTVERALPMLPMMTDNSQVILPTDDTRTKLLGRLHEELARRGQGMITLPETPPARTRLAAARMERAVKISLD